jgi:SAM-dependent methyltransferase
MSRRDHALQQIEDRIYRLTVGGAPDNRWQRLVSLVTESGYAAAAVRKRLGLPTPLETADRRVLEELIFPYYRNDIAFKKVLFVGCAIFTRHYQRKYFADKEFWTIEPDFNQARFGSSNHVVAPIEDASKHFNVGYFDVIFCNGIYGWGLDTLAQGEAAFVQCHNCLRSGGHLVFGWNDVPQRTPFSLEQIKSRNLFSRLQFPALKRWRYFTGTRHRHVFDFYQK